MTDLFEKPDEEAADNAYLGKIIFYVEGEEDKYLLETFAFSQLARDVEVKEPPSKGGGCNYVIDRVQDERQTNRRVFGIVDGEFLLVLNQELLFLTHANRQQCIQLNYPEYEGIFFLPCWEVENLFLAPDALIEELKFHGPSFAAIRSREEEVIIRFLSRCAVSLAEWAAWVCTQTANGIRKPERAEVCLGKGIKNCSQFRSEISRRAVVRGMTSTQIDIWRQEIKEIARKASNRKELLDLLIGRIDGKTFRIMVQKEFGGGYIMAKLGANLQKSGALPRLGQNLFNDASKMARISHSAPAFTA